MGDTFQLEIVTPEKMVVRDVAEEMQIPGKDGYLGILPGHAPLISELAVGQIVWTVTNEVGPTTGVVFEIEGQRISVPIANGSLVAGPVYLLQFLSVPPA